MPVDQTPTHQNHPEWTEATTGENRLNIVNGEGVIVPMFLEEKCECGAPKDNPEWNTATHEFRRWVHEGNTKEIEVRNRADHDAPRFFVHL